MGYELSNAPIPDWPIYKNVTDYGAIADDDVSDVDAFVAAINDCPAYHAIGVPNGKYIIDNAIDFTKNFIVLRGESRDNAILFFPKHMSEIEGAKTSNTPFITFQSGEHRGIENLSLVLRDEQKGTGYWRDPDCTKLCEVHWFESGEAMLNMRSETNSWVRDIYIKNSNYGINVNGVGSRQISIINVVLDQFINRKVGTDGDGHMVSTKYRPKRCSDVIIWNFLHVHPFHSGSESKRWSHARFSAQSLGKRMFGVLCLVCAWLEHLMLTFFTLMMIHDRLRDDGLTISLLWELGTASFPVSRASTSNWTTTPWVINLICLLKSTPESVVEDTGRLSTIEMKHTGVSKVFEKRCIYPLSPGAHLLVSTQSSQPALA